MGDPLTSLDELIWKQFEKVTQHAHRNYGWDKYDLSHLTDTATGFMGIGTGTYSLMSSYLTKSTLMATWGLTWLGIAPFWIYRNKKINESERDEDQNLLIKRGASTPPAFNFLRPCYLAFAVQTMYSNIQDIRFPTKDSSIAPGLMGVSISTGIMLTIASHYFRSQLMTPPSAKKPFWKTLYAGIAERFKPKALPPPATEPVKHYGAL